MMFNIGAIELIVILLVALIVVGPKDLPRVARAIARFVRYLKNLFNDFKQELELDETLKELKDIERDVKSTFKSADVRGDLQKAGDDLTGAVRSAKEAAEKKN